MANDNPDFDSTKLDNEVTAHFAKWKEALEDLKKALAALEISWKGCSIEAMARPHGRRVT